MGIKTHSVNKVADMVYLSSPLLQLGSGGGLRMRLVALPSSTCFTFCPKSSELSVSPWLLFRGLMATNIQACVGRQGFHDYDDDDNDADSDDHDDDH